jgi:hypothetical protein
MPDVGTFIIVKGDIDFTQGDDIAFILGFGDIYGDPYDLTGWAVEAQIRATPGSPILLVEFSCTVVLPQIGDDTGTVLFETDRELTRALPGDSVLAFDAQFTDPYDKQETWVSGRAIVRAEVTREVDEVDGGEFGDGTDGIIDGGTL